jgi:hypothetical protein
VHVYSLDNGAVFQYRDLKSGQDIPAQLQTQSTNDYSIRLRVAGSRVYVIASNTVKYYNLENPADAWTGEVTGAPLNFVNAFLGQDHLIVLARENALPPAPAAPPAAHGAAPALVVPPPALVIPPGVAAAGQKAANPAATLRLLTISRAPQTGGRESGLLDGMLTLPSAAAESSCQPVTGGLYYLAADRSLHYLHGAATGK